MIQAPGFDTMSPSRSQSRRVVLSGFAGEACACSGQLESRGSRWRASWHADDCSRACRCAFAVPGEECDYSLLRRERHLMKTARPSCCCPRLNVSSLPVSSPRSSWCSSTVAGPPQASATAVVVARTRVMSRRNDPGGTGNDRSRMKKMMHRSISVPLSRPAVVRFPLHRSSSFALVVSAG
jgi:hypothetical protein